MFNYQTFLLSLSAVTITSSTVIDLTNVDLKASEYYSYQIIQETQEKVDLKIYYESLCPGCRTFHTGPLAEVLQKIGSYLDFKTYPYGNALTIIINGKTVVVCQHGEEECYGNKLHACAIDNLKDIIRAESYNACMMAGSWGGNGSTDMDATKCGESMGIDADPIIQCAKGQKGEDLLKYYGNETNKVPNMTYVPYVTINGHVYSGSFDDLMRTVCKAFTNPPPPCQE